LPDRAAGGFRILKQAIKCFDFDFRMLTFLKAITMEKSQNRKSEGKAKDGLL
jgi:hypothetical protein